MEQPVIVFAGALAGGMIVFGLLRRALRGGPRSQQGELTTQLSVVSQQLEHLRTNLDRVVDLADEGPETGPSLEAIGE